MLPLSFYELVWFIFQSTHTVTNTYYCRHTFMHTYYCTHTFTNTLLHTHFHAYLLLCIQFHAHLLLHTHFHKPLLPHTLFRTLSRPADRKLGNVCVCGCVCFQYFLGTKKQKDLWSERWGELKNKKRMSNKERGKELESDMWYGERERKNGDREECVFLCAKGVYCCVCVWGSSCEINVWSDERRKDVKHRRLFDHVCEESLRVCVCVYVWSDLTCVNRSAVKRLQSFSELRYQTHHMTKDEI